MKHHDEKGRKTQAQSKVARVMREYKGGELHSGSKKGPVVKSQKQAVAISLKESGLSRKSGK